MSRGARTARRARPLGPLSLNVIDLLKRSFVVAGICAGPPDACHALHAGHTLHAMHAGHTLHAMHAGHTLHAGHTARNTRRSRTNCVALHSERAVKTGCPQVPNVPHPQGMTGNAPMSRTARIAHTIVCSSHIGQQYQKESNRRIYVSVSWVIIGSDNGLSPFRRQTII